ncbi:site-specific integrase [Actinoplanes sp. NPDC051411]|uniref:site-specific integrase n=1 Tax=Actinoplanes sp. NPDC051411 TaxID=3155522 RepID=UPI0034453261
MNDLPDLSNLDQNQLLRLLLERLPAAPAETTPKIAAPTFDEYLDKVAGAVGAGTRRANEPYWNRIKAVWGNRRIDEPTPLEIADLAAQAQQNAIVRSNSKGGRSAAEHVISALRCMYHYAVADRIISEADNPALRVSKPRRLISNRRALDSASLTEIIEITGSTGNDPDLDLLLIRFHLETAARRGGALAVRPRDLDPEQSLVQLREKGGTTRWQPVSPSLMASLQAHGQQRFADDPDDQLLRYRNGNPITHRRYDNLWVRLGKHLPWIAKQNVSTHWLRYTTLTWVERNFGQAIARGYAGHSDGGPQGVTAIYVRPTLYEIATALSSLTGEHHPLAPTETGSTQTQSPARVPLPKIYQQIYDDAEHPS